MLACVSNSEREGSSSVEAVGCDEVVDLTIKDLTQSLAFAIRAETDSHFFCFKMLWSLTFVAGKADATDTF